MPETSLFCISQSTVLFASRMMKKEVMVEDRVDQQPKEGVMVEGRTDQQPKEGVMVEDRVKFWEYNKSQK